MLDFTYKNYKKLITTLKEEDYNFSSFSKIKFSNEEIKQKVLLRHDVDLSLEKALEMAHIDHELNISSTFFIYLGSPFYNVISEYGEKIIHKIIDLQHYIGLHVDLTKYNDRTIAQIPYYIKKEIDFMEDYFKIKIDSVSFHKPLSLNFLSRLELSHYPHSYEPVFLQNFKYFADSAAEWRYGHPLSSNAFKEKKNLQILIHPIWWNNKKTSDVNCIEKFRKNYEKSFNANIDKELEKFWIKKKLK